VKLCTVPSTKNIKKSTSSQHDWTTSRCDLHQCCNKHAVFPCKSAGWMQKAVSQMNCCHAVDTLGNCSWKKTMFYDAWTTNKRAQRSTILFLGGIQKDFNLFSLLWFYFTHESTGFKAICDPAMIIKLEAVNSLNI